MRKLSIGIGLITATATAALGQAVKTPFVPPSELAACAQGFTAAPATYKTAQKTGQSYTCTGPQAVCSGGFKLQPVSVSVPAPPGSPPNTFGSTVTVPNSGPVIVNGKMVYTCAEPPTAPQ